MVLARPAGLAPRALAELVADALRGHPAVTETGIAGPGFVNWRLAPGFWHDRLRDVLASGRLYGASRVRQGRKVNVEYVSANPTGPMHVGHARGAVFGDVLASLLEKAGFLVCREYYINDAGAQVDVLARSTHLRYREALGEAIGEIPEGLYPGDYLKATGAALAARDGRHWLDRPDSEWLAPVRAFAIDAMMAMIRDDLARLGVRHAVFSSERALQQSGAVDAALKTLEEAGLIYTGVLEPPKGKAPEDWEPRPQTLFAATRFGDDVDRPLRKSDGSFTYFAADIAYHYDKFRRGSAELIDVLGADHGGYVKRMQAAVTAISGGRAVLDCKICQLVHLYDHGEPVKMSKRAGTFVTLADVVDQVGKDVVRFMMLTRRNDQTIDFDFAKVVDQSRDNVIWYVQYAHARAQSVLRRARAEVDGTDPAALATVELAPRRSGGARPDPAARRLAARGRERRRGARATPGGLLPQRDRQQFSRPVEQGQRRCQPPLHPGERAGSDPRPAGAGPGGGVRDPVRPRHFRHRSGDGDALMAPAEAPERPYYRTGDTVPGPSRSLFRPIAAGLVAVAFAGALWFAWTRVHGTAESGGVPLIRADPSATKVKPDQPGGEVVTDQGRSVYTMGGDAGGSRRPRNCCRRPSSRCPSRSPRPSRPRSPRPPRRLPHRSPRRFPRRPRRFRPRPGRPLRPRPPHRSRRQPRRPLPAAGASRSRRPRTRPRRTANGPACRRPIPSCWARSASMSSAPIWASAASSTGSRPARSPTPPRPRNCAAI